jgi:leukotriene-A4 hydrolase
MRVALLLLCALMLPIPSIAIGQPTDERRVDEHSWAEPDKVVIRDIGLDLRVDFATRRISGRADLALDWKDRSHRRLLLDTRDLEIERVLGKRRDSGWYRLKWRLADPDPIFGQKLTIDLQQPYDSVRVVYRTSPQASGLQWLEPSMTAGGRHPFMFSQSQAIHARSWVPLQDTPSVRYTYSARVRTAPAVIALMSADNPPDAPRDGDYLFRMVQPIPSYLMAIAVGDLVFKPISARAGVWAEPETVDAAVAEFIDTERMIEVAEALYGPYRWQRYDLLILPPSFPFGGMENPRLSFITPTVITGDRSLVSLIAHELAHSWSGNLVTNASWKDIWLNEGFTSYVENRIVEALFGDERAQMENVIAQNELLAELADLPEAYQRLVLPALEGIDPDEALTDVAYTKGQWFLIFLERRFGRERFDPFLRQWFDAHAFQSVTSHDFERFLRSELLPTHPGAVSEAELDAWLRGPGVPQAAEPAVSDRLQKVGQARERWLSRRITAGEIDTSAWVTQEWVHFIEGLPTPLEAERLQDLDQAFRLTGTRNVEIAQRWYPLAERSGYFEARPAIASFLSSIGRRKLIMPIYQALASSEDGLAFARDVFARARPGYHPITIGSVEAALAEPAADSQVP